MLGKFPELSITWIIWQMCINAIHVIQEKLDVTGTTAREASTTFSGSFGAMKSAVKNLLGFMASGGDVEGAMVP